jgi:hypothetical protein
MSDSGWIEPIVERVVGEVLESHVAQLRGEIVRRVTEQIAANQPVTPAPATSSSAADLARAVSEIQVGASQKEILRALLDSSSRYAARAALFVVKGSQATGWQARGFENSNGIKDFVLDSHSAGVMKAIADRATGSVSANEFDAKFVSEFGDPGKGGGWLSPLILKEKVAALFYADGRNNGGLLDAGSLEVLVLATSAWLEVNALRKHAHKEPAAEAHAAPAHEAASAQAFNDPFAGHAPAFAMAAAASAGGHGSAAATPAPEVEHVPAAEAQSSAVEVQSAAAVASEPVVEPLPTGQAHTEVQGEAVPAGFVEAPPLSPADQEVHRKAQRFARLLVDEVKLYNQAKVSEGRKKKDLYDRLKDTIEKSRSTYQKRYGNTVAASGNYFQHELVRSLAEDDPSIMGPNFQL